MKLKAALLGCFESADYAYKTRQALVKWIKKGGMTEYIVSFSEHFTHCSDVDSAEALFPFLDSFSPQLHAFIYMQRSRDLQDAMQIAE